ncbi:hypothetical protein PLICRDRAFT_49182 [Plicaturopsis crispa FD-325 SS-3]|nr:hypothetical protein PLICRDRAFT_49182 [Plicaturopsis crispa FD-325 SS-3]
MVKYITGDELAAIIKSDKVAHKDYAVIDVRDDDFVGGNIINCTNSPAHEFHLNVNTLIQTLKDVPTVVFHCALSQVRGPKSARIFEEVRNNVKPGLAAKQDVLVLQGGFTQFQAKFKDDPLLVENWDEGVWASDWS